ncbi:MAG: hypothetical protein NZM40_04110 [Sphingomonadaceae bacterium]|uniref:hypothetical protein n=1 Tax=Thermaurantiacus sp. TaxID=2820283 RepID=UPI00298F0252|nr:hypothetical protein [Thermaurantiacus sp.]MCS6986609.1 hypothetical protein [Sphingomonadaceae bacterium]
MAAIRRALAADPWFADWLGRAPEGPALVLEGFDVEPWASLTFQGAIHRLAFRLSGPVMAVEAAWDRIEALLEAGDVPLGGQFLADWAAGEKEAVIGPDGRMTLRVEIEALTIEA